MTHLLRTSCLRLALAASFILGLVLPSQADIHSINKDVWRMKFGVSDAQLADTGWMNADSDGDGVLNKNEIPAGTNPFSSSSTVAITSISQTGGDVTLTFPTQDGKRYRAESTTSLTSPAWVAQPQPTATVVNGTGAELPITIPYVPSTYYRIIVDDLDSDGDGASNWAEKIAGFNPTNAATGKDDNGVPVNDGIALPAAILSSNVVTVATTNLNATQPPDPGTPAIDPGTITVSRSGPLDFSVINVPLQKAGTAIEGTDYDGLPAFATFTVGVKQIVLTINPKFVNNIGLLPPDGRRKTNVTAIVKAMAGVGFTLGSASSGSVVINPAGNTLGTGLTGQYHNAANATYATQQTIFDGAAELTQTDATIDLANSIVSIALGNPCTVTTSRPHQIATTATVRISDVSSGSFSPTINATLVATSTGTNTFTVPVNCTALPTSSLANAKVGGTNGWDSATGPIGMSAVAAGGVWSARWTGQILPQYSENYFIDLRSDDSAKVWVNGVLLIDRWATQTPATDYTNSIFLNAGVLYDIQIDYWNNGGGSAEARLYWWSESQVRQIIPQNRLFPAEATSAKFTAITSRLEAVGYTGVPFSFNVTTPDISGNVSYALDANSGPLPPGLGLTPSNGAVTGTPTVAGTYNVAINATNAAAPGTPAEKIRGSSVVTFTIYPTGGVSREVLGVAGGPNVSDIVLPSGTPAHDTIATVDDDDDYAANTGERLRGYLVPPKTGNYYFWIAANNNAELWISNDSEAVNKVRRASVTASSGRYVWNNSVATQQSQWLALVAGQKYYFEVLHNKGPAGVDFHYVEMGWCQDDVGTAISVAGAPNPLGTKTLILNGAGATLSGYPLSGTVPGYIFQPYDYPTTVVVSGDLYGGNLGPQGSSTTKASGSATLRTNAPGNAATSAILHFNYGNLSTPKTAYHLHTDAFASHPAGEIVFDLDDIDSFHPELITEDGGYIWDFATVGTFTSVQQIRDAIALGKIYLNVHSVSYPNGEIRGNLILIDGSQTPPGAYPEPTTNLDVATDAANAARFLNQATFGASPADVAYVQANGFAAWIDKHVNPLNPLYPLTSRTSNEVVANITSDINDAYPSRLFTDAWWKYTITGEDQLRQRFAQALCEIMVVSWNDDTGPLARNGRILADYYDNMVDYCLPTSGLPDSGTFRGILKNVTLTPAMGRYLDMLGNIKEDLTIGRHPNENYARELMQLFSTGINRVWDDGRFVLNADANVVPTYTQPTILGVSALLTGWHNAQATQANGRLGTSTGPATDNLNPMSLVPSQHDLNAKLLLNHVVSPPATGRTPRVNISSIATTGGCTVTTSTVHGLRSGDTIRIDGVTGGAFTGGLPAINTTLKVGAVTTTTSFTVPVTCTAGAGAAGTVTGATVVPAGYSGTTTGIAAVTGSQSDSTNFAGWTLPHPYDQYGLNELDAVIDNIVSNDNVPPYVCRQLIQRLVTSDPSPGYLYRVVQKFKDDGSPQHVRGNMVEVLRQILLDGEARSTINAAANNAFGKQREPMMRLTGPARAFPAVPYTGTYTQLTGINANKFRVVTSTVNDFNSGFTVALNFKGNYTSTVPPVPFTNPTTTSYSVAGTSGIAGTHLNIVPGTGITPNGANTIITTNGDHGLPGPTNTVWPTGVSGKFSGTINGAITATVTGANTFTVPITTTNVFQIASIAVGSPCVVTTTTPHGFALSPTTTTGVTINGVIGGSFVGTINSTSLSVVGITATTFSVTGVNCLLAPSSYTTWREVSNPCRVTTVGPHGLTNGNTVTISGVSGGSFTPTINGSYPVTVVDATSFVLKDAPGPVSCAVAATVNTGSIVGSNTLDVTATGMVNVTYSQLAGSTTMTVNTTGPQTNVAVPNPNSATTTLKSRVYLKPVTVASTVAIANINVATDVITTQVNHGLTNGNTVTFASISGGAFTPTLNGNTFTVSDVTANTFKVASNCTTAPTNNTGTITGSWIPMAAEGVFDVQTTPGSTFTVTTLDTPAGPRSGNLIIPKVSTSYTPISGNSVQYNCNVNHHMLTGDHVWVDVPGGIGTPLIDAEYIVTAPITGSGIAAVDEDHFQTSRLPITSGLSTPFPTISGANNSITLWPLQLPAALLTRSGNVSINQSTFNLGSTEGTLTQSPLNAPTVFNYFLPYYRYPGSLSNNGIDSPEFQITTDTNISNLTNSLTNMLIGTGGGNSNLAGLSSFSNGNGSVVMDIGNYATLAKTQDSGISGPAGLVSELARLLVGASLETATQATIENFVKYKRTITNFSQASPTVITTSTPHGLVLGDRIAINDVTGGTFSGGSTSINGSWVVLTVPTATTITIGTAVAVPVPENCTANGSIVYTNANISNFPMNVPVPGPTALQMRDRVRAIIHLIITSAEYAVQK